jgi:hypothetical protein
MKIKKHGKKYDEKKVTTETFECENCGCEFVCKADEYYRDYGGAERIADVGTHTYTYYTISNQIKDYLVCSCPECHQIVKKIDIRECATSWSYSTIGESVTLNDTNTCTIKGNNEKC